MTHSVRPRLKILHGASHCARGVALAPAGTGRTRQAQTWMSVLPARRNDSSEAESDAGLGRAGTARRLTRTARIVTDGLGFCPGVVRPQAVRIYFDLHMWWIGAAQAPEYAGGSGPGRPARFSALCAGWKQCSAPSPRVDAGGGRRLQEVHAVRLFVVQCPVLRPALGPDI